MARTKKSKIKKKLLTFLIAIIIILSLYLIETRSSNKYKLKEKGYNEAEIEEVLKNKTIVTFLLGHDYDELYIKIINVSTATIENLEKYVEYYKNNNTAPLEDVVYLINNNITNKYSENLMSLIKHKYFIKNNLDRYLNYLDKTKANITNTISNVNSNIDYSYYTNIKKTDTSKGYSLITNKYYQLDSNYQASNLITMDNNYSRVSGAQLEKTTYEAFKKLSDDARQQGYYIVNVSAYRSYYTQNYLYNNYKAQHGLAWADSYSARPGHSEHQTGLALDVGTASTSLSSFENTKEFTWMKNNAYKYGFILRYPKDKEYITGYNYESWHYRYVGIEPAKFIHENNLTFEEYYAYYVENAK